MTRLAIFDCDGTLVDSGATIHTALRSTFDTHGLECPPRDVTKKVIGLSLDEAMAALVPDADHGALSQTYRDAFFAMRGAGDLPVGYDFVLVARPDAGDLAREGC